jgi:hypothetical protein
MKTSEKEGVSDRPSTPVTCPNTRHRSSAAHVDVGSAHLDAVRSGSDTPAAPTPLPPPPMPRITPLPLLSTSNDRAAHHCERGCPGLNEVRLAAPRRLPRPSSSGPRLVRATTGSGVRRRLASASATSKCAGSEDIRRTIADVSSSVTAPPTRCASISSAACCAVLKSTYSPPTPPTNTS